MVLSGVATAQNEAMKFLKYCANPLNVLTLETIVGTICEEQVCKILLLKSSNIPPISLLMVEVEGEELMKLWLDLPLFLAALEWFFNTYLISS